jgi:hypothetical protein
MGMGLIVTTVILMIMFMINKDQSISDAEIIERARGLGMVMADEVESSRDTLSSYEQEIEQSSVADDAQDDAQDDAYREETEPDTSKNDLSDTSTSETVNQVEISIVGGEYSDAVTQKLKKAGVIDDVDDFNEYLAVTGYDDLILPGTYTIPLGSDYDTVIGIITGNPENGSNSENAENE